MIRPPIQDLVELLARLAARRMLFPRALYPSLAMVSLAIFGAVLAAPVLEIALDWYFQRNGESKFANPWLWLGAGAPLLLTFLFAMLAHKFPVRTVPEPLVHTPVIGSPVKVGGCRVRSYCGSVEMISDVEVIVTSENHDLRLASFGGTSVSARMRRLTATYDQSGKVTSDNLSVFISKWKAERPPTLTYPLGTCVVAPPFNASRLGVKSIVMAVTLELTNTGENVIDEHRILDVCKFAINHCHEHGFSSLFVPTFGIGGGRIRADKIDTTLGPLLHLLERDQRPLQVYIGTYRASDAVVVMARLARYIDA